MSARIDDLIAYYTSKRVVRQEIIELHGITIDTSVDITNNYDYSYSDAPFFQEIRSKSILWKRPGEPVEVTPRVYVEKPVHEPLVTDYYGYYQWLVEMMLKIADVPPQNPDSLFLGYFRKNGLYFRKPA